MISLQSLQGLPPLERRGGWMAGDQMRSTRFAREFFLALVLCAIIIVLVVVTSDSAPQWIYQGF